ncbi:MAG: hypothetical protein KBF93_24685 [Leptospiraceae bacterium]|jgi:hypothetical protein|nr:hypothetical protein [Leptospiraceae bacterium]
MKLILNSIYFFLILFLLNCDNSIYVKHVYTDFKKIGAYPNQPVDTYEITRVTTIRTPETINTSRKKNIYYYTFPPILKLVRFAISTGESGIVFLEDPESEDNHKVVLFKPAPDKYVMVTKMLCIVDKDEKLNCQ